MGGTKQQSWYGVVLLATWALVTVEAQPVAGQADAQRQDLVASLDANDVATLLTRCGGAEPLAETFELVRKHACSRDGSGTGKILAFEDNRQFIYALADMSQDAKDNHSKQEAARPLRRVFLLKPTTLVVEDLLSSPSPELSMRYVLQCAAEPKIEADRFRLTVGDTEIVGKTILPVAATLKTTPGLARDDRPGGFRLEVTPQKASQRARFLHVFETGPEAERGEPTRWLGDATSDKGANVIVSSQDKEFYLKLPVEGFVAGEMMIRVDGKVTVPNRLLPSGVMPHGPQGARLMERWDAPYRRDRLPGWDVGRPCTHLVPAVEDKTFRAGRAIVLGCGSGTNAIFLAKQGFEVTGVDVSPTALAIAAEKADRIKAEVEWILADVTALPQLEPYDLIFDRGCYHHVCQYNSPAYVETLRRLSHPGTRALILAGSPADGNRGGPPRIKEETIRRDFSELYEFEWLRHIQFDSRNPDARGPSAWSIHLRRKED